MISKELRRALKRNGASFNFDIDIELIQAKKTEALAIYAKHDIHDVNEILVNFLAYFLNKELLFINKFHHADSLHFNLETSLKIMYAVKAIERDFELKGLIPFGMLYREHMDLFIDENDNVYANMDDLLILFGNNPFEALTNILNNVELERVEL